MANTLLLDINSLFNDDDIADIILVPQTAAGKNDDITAVPCVKAILAARSPVFRRMLYGEFRETRAGDDRKVEVKLDYSGRVLSLLAEFMFTDQLASLNVDSGPGARKSCTLEETARLLTNLSGCAHYFDIPKLENDIKAKLTALMLDHPYVACAILDESSKLASGEELVRVSIERVRARPKAALLHCNGGAPTEDSANSIGGTAADSAKNGGGVASLSASLLEQVVFDEQSAASELTKFLCLKRWVEGCNQQVTADEVDPPRKELDADEIVSSRTPQTVPRKQLSRPSKTKLNDSSNSKSQNDDPSTTESQYQQRLDIVKRLATKLDLSLIPASDLSTTITDSKLMSTHDLYQAYRLQALNAERTKSKVFVEGAGLGEVNGTYLQRGVHEGTPMYNKEGVWEDREEVFRIFLCTYSNGNKSWCLSIVPKGKEPGKTTDLDFYECPVSYGVTGGSYSAENGVGVVPTKGWKLVKYGQLPMPNCSLIAGCLEDVP